MDGFTREELARRPGVTVAYIHYLSELGILTPSDYFGRTVNLAARIAAHAGPGQVLVSDNVVGSCTDPAFSFVELGPVELKGVSRPVRLHQANRND